VAAAATRRALVIRRGERKLKPSSVLDDFRNRLIYQAA
jgi:hypothetical protein